MPIHKPLVARPWSLPPDLIKIKVAELIIVIINRKIMEFIMKAKTVAPRLLLTTLATSLLIACGGGGGGSGGGTNADLQGFWTGPSSSGYTISAVILDTGETWGIYSSGSTVYGALYGTSTTSGNTATISGTDFNFITNSGARGTMTGPITAKSSMSLTSSGGTVTASLTYSSSYETAATASGVTGTWSYIGRSRGYTLIPANITIDATGNFTLSQTTCATSGSIVPRPGGKNVYNITLTTSGGGCAAGQSTLTGVTYLDTTVTPNKFFALALTSGKDDGLIVIGTKQ